jgi:ABC-type sugar transport system permease subunit
MFDQANPRYETLFWAGATIIFIAVGSYLVALFVRWLAARFRLNQREQNQIFWGFLFASPWIIGFVIFVVGPSLASLYYSFTEYKLGGSPEWIGVQNFRELIQASGRDGRNFKAAMYNSLYYAVIGVPLQVSAALIMALLLNTALKGMRMFRLIYYLPVILAGGPAILLAWRYMFASNGGFVNESLSKMGEFFAPFNWLYRGFIFCVEGFNGFFIGIARGDPTGPLAFLLPAFLGALVLFLLIRGDWNPGKRALAQRTAELVMFGMGLLLAATGLVAEPVDVTWLLVFTVLALLAIAVNTHQGHESRVRAWQIIMLAAYTLLAAVSLIGAEPEATAVDHGIYLLLLAACAGAIGLTFLPVHGRQRLNAITVAGIVMGGVALAHFGAAGLGHGQASIVFKYLTFQSAIEEPGSEDYLEEGFNLQYMDSEWLFVLLAAVCIGALVLNARRPEWRRPFLTVAFAAFLAMTASAARDGVRYFNAYDDIAQANDAQTFHFARYRDAVSSWPDDNHDPKWLSSDLWVKPSVILINMWSAGAGMLIFLAALKGVPKSLYEAATVDGANRWQRFVKITLPMISPAMFYNVVIGMIAALQTFEAVYILRTTETETSVMSAAFYLYRRTFEQANIGEGAAMSWVLAVIIVGLTVAQFRYSNWVNYEV